MKSAKFFTFLAAFLVAIACGGNLSPTDEPGTNNPGQNPDPNQTGCEPNCPVEIKTISRALASFNPGGQPIYLDGRDTGRLTSLTASVMLEATEGRHDIEIRRSGATDRLVALAPDTEFSARVAMTMIVNEIRRDYSGDWGRKDFPSEATRRWDMQWDCNDPRIPGTNVCIVDDGAIFRGVYPNDLLGLCVDPSDISVALAEGRAPRIVATPECNDLMRWGRTIEDANGLRGEEIENYLMDLRDPERMVFQQDWQRLVPI